MVGGAGILWEVSQAERDDADSDGVGYRVVCLLRYTLDLPAKLPTKFKLPARTNAQFDVWVNGVVAVNNIFERSGHYEYPINDDGQRAFKPGKNVIAIRVSRNVAQGGDQIFDPGLVASLPWTPVAPKAGDAGKAAWVVVANTVLNLDETVTRR